MRGSFELTREIDIDASHASPDLVFRFFTDAALLQRWLCVAAEIDPRPGIEAGGCVTSVCRATIRMRMPRRLTAL